MRDRVEETLCGTNCLGADSKQRQYTVVSDLYIASLSKLLNKDCQNKIDISYLTLRQCTITLRSTIVRIERACKFPGSVLLKVF